jgi:hypothetical protein
MLYSFGIVENKYRKWCDVYLQIYDEVPDGTTVAWIDYYLYE